MSGGRSGEPRWRIRLPAGENGEPGTRALVTIAVLNRRPALADAELAGDCVVVLDELAQRHEIDVLAYCFMPDHAHLLLEVRSSTGIVEFVGAFKGWELTTRRSWQRGCRGKLWRRSCHDYLLRERDDEWGFVWYVLENPVRRGIGGRWNEYPFAGSIVYDLSDGDLS